MLRLSRWLLVIGYWIVAVFLQEIFSKLFAITPNFGVTFGWGNKDISLILSIVVLVVVLRLYARQNSWGLLLIIIGGLVNLLDRLKYGYVRDYWSVPFSSIKNNLADWLIFIGMIVIICNLESWWKKKNM